MSDIVLKRTEAKTFLDDKKKQEDVKETDDRWGSKVTLSGLLNVIDGVSGESITRSTTPSQIVCVRRNDVVVQGGTGSFLS